MPCTWKRRGWKELYGIKIELDINQVELVGFNMSKQTEIDRFPSHTFSGVGISRANTALSGPYCDIWGGRVHC